MNAAPKLRNVACICDYTPVSQQPEQYWGGGPSAHLFVLSLSFDRIRLYRDYDGCAP
jgi:hypothetical protein